MFEIQTITNKYPLLLKEIAKPPEQLFVRGNVEVLESKYPVAVVGTRRCTAYGRATTKQFVGGLARPGVCIVSGLALGVDQIAHTAALENNIPTVAVLGSPIDDESIYPASNQTLATKILEAGGALVSEYPVGTPTYPHNFLHRNRIIAGISLGTLVVEAPAKSGALSTAQHSLDANRSVYAVPGSITSMLSKGSNELIKQGALCATNPQDILDDLGIQQNNIKENNGILSKEEEQVFEVLQNAATPLHIDELIEQSTIDTSTISRVIISLVLKDRIKEIEANTYVIASV